jgi:hypothetical protein
MLGLTRHCVRRHVSKVVVVGTPLILPKNHHDVSRSSSIRRHVRSLSEITSSVEKQGSTEKELMRLMNYTFRSRAVLLGTMSDEQWEKTFSGIEGWLGQKRRGYTLDSAERLTTRLIQEYLVMNPWSPHYRARAELLEKYQTFLLKGWMEMIERYPKSQLAFIRAADTFLRLQDWRNHFIYTSDPEFLREEFLILMNAWLKLEYSSEGCRQASALLLKATEKENLTILSKNVPEIGKYFETAINQCLSKIRNEKDSIDASSVSSLLNRMKQLSQQPGWENNMQIPTTAEKALLDHSITQRSILNTSSQSTGAIHDRIIQLIQQSDLDEIRRTIESMEAEITPDPKACALLTSFFASKKDAKNSSQWLNHLYKKSNGRGIGREYLTGKRFRQVLLAIQRDRDFQGGGADVAEDILQKMQNMDDPPISWQEETTKAFEILLAIWGESQDDNASLKYLEAFGACLRGGLLKSPSVLQSIIKNAPPNSKQDIIESCLKVYAVSGKNFANAHMEALEVTIAGAGEVGMPAKLMTRVLRKTRAISERIGRSALTAATLMPDNSEEDIAGLVELLEDKNSELRGLN